jgi:hypothetical protein
MFSGAIHDVSIGPWERPTRGSGGGGGGGGGGAGVVVGVVEGGGEAAAWDAGAGVGLGVSGDDGTAEEDSLRGCGAGVDSDV